jgi:hypothetical protein
MPQSPLTLRAAAVVQAVESVVVLAATVLAGVDAATGQSYHVSSGIALTVIGAAAAAALAWVALGVARARRWSRTPALLTQLFFGIVGIYLLQGHRLDWGVPSVVLAVAGFATLFAPPTMRALTGGDEAASGTAPPAPSPERPAARPARRGTATAADQRAARPAARKTVPAPGRKASSAAPERKRPAG